MSAFEELEEKYPEIVDMMADEFNSHEFILKLAQRYQRLYVQALSEYEDNDQPFLTVHSQIAKRLKKREDLVKHICNKTSRNIFGDDSDAAVWLKVKK
jgi:hypothetical protein